MSNFIHDSCFENSKMLKIHESMAVSAVLRCHIIFNILFVHLQVFGVTCNAHMVLILNFIRLESRLWLIKKMSCNLFFEVIFKP